MASSSEGGAQEIPRRAADEQDASAGAVVFTGRSVDRFHWELDALGITAGAMVEEAYWIMYWEGRLSS